MDWWAFSAPCSGWAEKHDKVTAFLWSVQVFSTKISRLRSFSLTLHAAYDITRVKRQQMRWENETADETAKETTNEMAKWDFRWDGKMWKQNETGIYMHEQLVAKHQCFTPRTTKRSLRRSCWKEEREEAKNIEPEDEVFKKNRRCRKTKKSVAPKGTTDKLHCSSWFKRKTTPWFQLLHHKEVRASWEHR